MSKSDLQLQIEHNNLIEQYNKNQYDTYYIAYYKEPEIEYINPKQTALELSLEIEKHLDLDDPWITLCPGSVHETLYNCTQLLRTLAKEIKSNE